MKNAEESLGLKSKDTLASSIKPSSDKVKEVNELLDDFSNVFDAQPREDDEPILPSVAHKKVVKHEPTEAEDSQSSEEEKLTSSQKPETRENEEYDMH